MFLVFVIILLFVKRFSQLSHPASRFVCSSFFLVYVEIFAGNLGLFLLINKVFLFSSVNYVALVLFISRN